MLFLKIFILPVKLLVQSKIRSNHPFSTASFEIYAFDLIKSDRTWWHEIFNMCSKLSINGNYFANITQELPLIKM